MANIYADLIKKGKKTLEEVPQRIREAVEDILKKEGKYDESI